MRRSLIVALLALAVAGCSSPQATATVTVGGSGPGRVMTYTCSAGECVQEIGVESLHTAVVAVPVGSVVRVDVGGAGLGPLACWITAADGRTVAQDSGSGSYAPSCEAVATG